jgi:uncharacterized protein YktB (UPF0637 family)
MQKPQVNNETDEIVFSDDSEPEMFYGIGFQEEKPMSEFVTRYGLGFGEPVTSLYAIDVPDFPKFPQDFKETLADPYTQDLIQRVKDLKNLLLICYQVLQDKKAKKNEKEDLINQIRETLTTIG